MAELNKYIEEYGKVPFIERYDVLVAGGGVAGVAAALAANRAGKKVLLIEKSVILGGLATLGLINLFVPMCNGRGKQIIYGMAEELLRESIKYGYDTIPAQWQNGEPGEKATTRYVTRFSANIFALVLTEMLTESGVNILLDTVISKPIMEKGVCKGLVVENKSGRQYYEGKIVIDTTGDSDILYRAGVPTYQGGNYFTYCALSTSLDLMQKAIDKKDISRAYGYTMGGEASLYGTNHPEGMPLFSGTTAESVTEYIVKNQKVLLQKIKEQDRKSRDIITLPGMAQFRTTRRLVGDYELQGDEYYKHFEDSISAVCDFEIRDRLYEIPYRCLVKTGFSNLITAGRSISAAGWAWDVTRVIPPAIVTGQAAGVAAAMAIDGNKPIYEIDVKKLQQELENQNVMIHFDDSLVPKEETEPLKMPAQDHF